MNDLELHKSIDGCLNYNAQVCSNIGELKNKINLENKRNFNIIHFNIRSLNKNFNELLIYLEDYGVNGIDIITLSETWNIDNIDRFQIPNFNIYYNDSHHNQNDGVIIYVNNKLSATVKCFDLTEVKLMEVETKIDNRTIKIIATYRPPSTNTSLFIEELQRYLTSNNMKNSLIIFVGDININIADSKDKNTLEYMNVMYSNSFASLINIPTRENTLTATVIDHIFVNTPNNLVENFEINPYVIHASLTDHYPIFLQLRFNGAYKEKTKLNFINKINRPALFSSIEKENWENVLVEEDPNLAYDLFINKFNTYINNNTIKIKLNSKNRPIKPWITKGLICSIRIRDTMKLQLNKHYEISKDNEYKRYRNKLTELIQHTKNEYYKQKVLEAGNNNKKIWDTINEATNSISNHSNEIQINNKVGQVLTNKASISNDFNKHFSDIGNEIAQTINTSDYEIPNVSSSKFSGSFFLNPVTDNEIINTIATLKNRSASGCDKISVQIIKFLHNYISKPIAHIINLIFKTSIVPDALKRSMVVPIHKSGTKLDKNNYRPISLLSNFAKIFEKCLNSRLIQFLDKNSVLSKNQYGFREGINTELAIAKLLESITSNLNMKHKCLAIFLDIKKAFDAVSHKILLKKLELQGIRGNVLNLFQNYLKGRYQTTLVNNIESEPLLVTRGIPQGSVLGPTLFLIYINELGDMKLPGQLFQYADDTALVIEGSSWEEAFKKATISISKIKNWLDTHELSLNSKKTTFLTFSPSLVGLPEENEIYIHNSYQCRNKTKCNLNCDKILKVDKIKYLGVEIDQHLKWNCHITNIVSKLRKMIYKFNILKHILNKETLLLVYRSLVESVIRYGIVAWGGLYDTHLHPLLICQKLILKIILKKEYMYPSKLLFQESKVLHVRNLYFLSLLQFVHKQQKEIQDYIVHPTRAYFNLHIRNIKPNIELIKRTFVFIGPKLYNSLPFNFKNITSLKRFTASCKNFLFENNIDEYFINKL